MKIVRTRAAMQRQSAAWVKSGESVGFVPTMGALHEGHLTLIRRARKECRRVVVSIYVNPTQFGPKEDLARYPRPIERDLALCRKEGADVVFAPQALYLWGHSTYVEETKMSQGREGAVRPGHFRGVATVVLKLFNLVRPTKAYFGQKDAQQVDVISSMVRDLDVPVKIVVVPTVRDTDGVALSSRNFYLSQEERKIAAEFARLLQHAARHELEAGKWLTAQLKKVPGLTVDYVEYAGHRLVAAIKVGQTRLLDNERLSAPTLSEGFTVATRTRRNTSIAFVYLKGRKVVDGEYHGICQITGSPANPKGDVKKLLAILRRYKGNGKCRMKVSGANREYVINHPGKLPLRVQIKLKKKGDSYGPFFLGSKQIGTAYFPQDDVTDAERRRRERYRPPPVLKF